MVTIILPYPHCGSQARVTPRAFPNGKQKDRSHACSRRSRENPTPIVSPEVRREEIVHASQEREPLARPHPSVRGLWGHRSQVDQKKGAQLPPLRTTLLAPDPQESTSTALELDELCSLVLKKAHDSWMWIALCRKSRQGVRLPLGRDRSRQDVPALVGGHCRGGSPGPVQDATF
ncbi:MAG: hypothetical protein E6J36_07000 [Chloroflexi bacterium]|nr:MAG: hypothetical protein E6J36_07000 [Chloroflexota bacterium]